MLTRQGPALAEIETQIELLCRHYWIIEPAKGPVSKGECRYCRETREFQNSIVEVERDY